METASIIHSHVSSSRGLRPEPILLIATIDDDDDYYYCYAWQPNDSAKHEMAHPKGPSTQHYWTFGPF